MASLQTCQVLRRKIKKEFSKMKGSETTGHCLAMLLGLTQDVAVKEEHGFLPSTRDGPKTNGIHRPLSLFPLKEKRVLNHHC